jgi:hypothetical protein
MRRRRTTTKRVKVKKTKVKKMKVKTTRVMKRVSRKGMSARSKHLLRQETQVICHQEERGG